MDEIRERLLVAMGKMRPAELSRLTGESESNISRYLKNRRLSLEFVVATCLALDISADWLLFGEGPMRRGETDLREVPVEQVIAEFNRRLYTMTESLRELERKVQEDDRFRERDTR